MYACSKISIHKIIALCINLQFHASSINVVHKVVAPCIKLNLKKNYHLYAKTNQLQSTAVKGC